MRPRLTLTIGVSGHRANKLAPDVQLPVRDRIMEVFRALDVACSDEHARDSAQTGTNLFSDEKPCIRLVSSLATGADILAAEAMPEGWRLDALIPFNAQNYAESDFEAENNGNQEGWKKRHSDTVEQAHHTGSVTILPSPNETGPQSSDRYKLAAEFMLRQIDILVAVWDGDKSHGEGGTRWIIDRALARKIPILWIDSKGERPAWELEGIQEDGTPLSPMIDVSFRNGPIAEIVAGQLAMPTAPGQREAGANTSTRYAEFLSEPVRRYSYWTAYDNLLNFVRLRVPVLRVSNEDPKALENWDVFQSHMSLDDGPTKRISSVLQPRVSYADRVATHYGHVYRSAYIAAYFLSVIVVLIALTGILGSHGSGHSELPLSAGIKTGIELFIIIVIAMLIRRGQKERWHQRWLEYRALAELLRHLRFLAHVGEYGAIHRLASASGPPASAWVHWYVRATIRELGLPGVELSREYQTCLIDAVRTAEIEPQINYHHENTEKLHRLQHALQGTGEICFVLIFIILGAFLFTWGFIELAPVTGIDHRLPIAVQSWMSEMKHGGLLEIKPYVTFVAAFLPTLGAALAGIRFTGDFEGFAERSSETRAALEDLSIDLEKLRHHIDLVPATTALGNIASAMAEDVAGWRSLYGRKYLEIPS